MAAISTENPKPIRLSEIPEAEPEPLVFHQAPRPIRLSDVDAVTGAEKSAIDTPQNMRVFSSFGRALTQSMADKPAAALQGATAYTRGTGLGLDVVMGGTADVLSGLKSEESQRLNQEALQGHLWPTKSGTPWYQIDKQLLPNVLNTWAAQIGDQIPIMVMTVLGGKAGKTFGKAIGAAAGITAGVATAGPEPTDIATVPVTAGIIEKTSTIAGGAAPMVLLETGSFLQNAKAYGIDQDIAERYARVYGPAAGAIEYTQQLWNVKALKGITGPMRKAVLGKIVMAVGGNAVEGLEEVSQGGLERFLLGKAQDEMKMRDPAYSAPRPEVFGKESKREFGIGFGIGTAATVTGGAYDAAGRIIFPARQVEVPTTPAIPSVAATSGPIDTQIVEEQPELVKETTHVEESQGRVQGGIAQQPTQGIQQTPAVESKGDAAVEGDQGKLVEKPIQATGWHVGLAELKRDHPDIYAQVIAQNPDLAEEAEQAEPATPGRKSTKGPWKVSLKELQEKYPAVYEQVIAKHPDLLEEPAAKTAEAPGVPQVASKEPGPVETAPPVQAEAPSPVEPEPAGPGPAVQTAPEPAFKAVDMASQSEPGQNTPVPTDFEQVAEGPRTYDTIQDVIAAAVNMETRNTTITDPDKIEMDKYFAERDLLELQNEKGIQDAGINLLNTLNDLAKRIKAGESFGPVWDRLIGKKERKTLGKTNDRGLQAISRALAWEIDRRNDPENSAEFAPQLDPNKDAKTARDVATDEIIRNMPLELQTMVTYMAEQNYNWGEYFVEQGALREAYQNYLARILDVPKAETSVGGRSGVFSTFTGRTMPRKFGSLAEASYHGYHLAIDNVLELMRIARSQMIRSMANQHLIQSLEKSGLGSTKRQEGWVHVPGMTRWVLVNAKPEQARYADRDFYVTDTRESLPNEFEKGDLVYVSEESANGYVDKITESGDAFVYWPKEQGGSFMGTYPVEGIRHAKALPRRLTEKSKLLHRAPFYVTPGIAKRVHAVIDPSLIDQNRFFRPLKQITMGLKEMIFTYSLFHPQAFIRDALLAGRINAVKPLDAWKIGKEAKMSLDPLVQLLVKNGLRINMGADISRGRPSIKDTWFEKLASYTKVGEAAWHATMDARDKYNSWVFDKVGGYAKIGGAILEMRYLMKKYEKELLNGTKSIDGLAAEVANLMNSRFGGMNYERMGISRTTQDIMRLFMLAHDWQFSNFKMLLDAFRGGDKGAIHRAAWGRLVTRAVAATIIFNFLMAAFDDDDFVERYHKAWETGNLRWLDIDITPIYRALGGGDDARKYFSLIGHFRDPIKFAAHPLLTTKHKGSVLTRFVMDAMMGQDWRGQTFTSFGELLGIGEASFGQTTKYDRDAKTEPVRWSQVPSFLAYEARSVTPIPLNNLIAFLAGELDAFDTITKGVGLMTASAREPQEPKTKGLRLRKPAFGKSTKLQKVQVKRSAAFAG